MTAPPPQNPCGQPCPDCSPRGDARVTPSWIGPDGTWPMPPGSGPCRTWPLESNCGCLSPSAGSWDENKTHAVEVATEILWRKTAGTFGLCKEIVRPCRAGCAEAAPRGGLAWPDPNGTAPTPASWYGTGDQLTTCGCSPSGGRCGCGPSEEIALPGPVYWEMITQPPDWRYPHRPPDRPPDLDSEGQLSDRYRLVVWIDGKVLHEPGWPVEWEPGQPLPPVYTPHRGEYWLHGNRLVRTDGGVWPACQDLNRPLQARAAYPDEAIGTFGVEYWRGIPVPVGGRRAVSILACELWKACVGDDSCRLPRGVQSISREGIDYTLVDQQQDMMANLPDVNGWIQAVNPRGMAERSTVWSPDMYRVRSEWTGGGRAGGGSPVRRRWG